LDILFTLADALLHVVEVLLDLRVVALHVPEAGRWIGKPLRWSPRIPISRICVILLWIEDQMTRMVLARPTSVAESVLIQCLVKILSFDILPFFARRNQVGHVKSVLLIHLEFSRSHCFICLSSYHCEPVILFFLLKSIDFVRGYLVVLRDRLFRLDLLCLNIRK